VVTVAALSGGLLAWARWPSGEAALACAVERVGLDDAGVARCGAGHPLSAAQALTIGVKLDLNRCTAAELALVPGVGPALASRIIAARGELGHFSSWGEVDHVTGVGLRRLETLQENVQLGEFDAGL